MCDRSIDLLEKIRKILSIENGRCKVIKKTLNIDDHVDCDNDYVDRDVKLIRFRCFRTSYSLESLFQGRRLKKKTKKSPQSQNEIVVVQSRPIIRIHVTCIHTLNFYEIDSNRDGIQSKLPTTYSRSFVRSERYFLTIIVN